MEESMAAATENKAGVGEQLDERQLLSCEPYEVFNNPVMGHEYGLLERNTDADEGFLRAEARYQTDARHFADHIHVHQDETFKVLSGELVVTINGIEQTLEEGERITLPAETPHFHGSTPGIETRVLYEVRPLQFMDTLLRTLATLAQDGRTNADGVPNLLQLAVTLDTHSEMVYFTGAPIVVQKLLFRLIAPLGRLRGYKADHPKAAQTENADFIEPLKQ